MGTNSSFDRVVGPKGYFGSEGSDMDLYIYCAVHVAIPRYGEGARAVARTKPSVVSSSARRGDKRKVE
jgi:hypothetical protein